MACFQPNPQVAVDKITPQQQYDLRALIDFT